MHPWSTKREMRMESFRFVSFSSLRARPFATRRSLFLLSRFMFYSSTFKPSPPPLSPLRPPTSPTAKLTSKSSPLPRTLSSSSNPPLRPPNLDSPPTSLNHLPTPISTPTLTPSLNLRRSTPTQPRTSISSSTLRRSRLPRSGPPLDQLSISNRRVWSTAREVPFLMVWTGMGWRSGEGE